MKKFDSIRRSLPVVFAAVVAFAGASAAQAQDAAPTASKIGFVSIERILKDSVPAKAAAAKLESEFSRRQKELQDTAARLKPLYDNLEKNGAVMPESERTRRQKELSDQDKDFQRRQREYNEDINQRMNEERTAVVDRANKVISQIAEAEKYDLIVQDAVYRNPRIDITDKVLKAMSNPSQAAATPSK